MTHRQCNIDQERRNAVDRMRRVWVVQIVFNEMTPEGHFDDHFITVEEVPYTFHPSQVDASGRFISNTRDFIPYSSYSSTATVFSHAQLVRRVVLDEFGF
jgi:hypothetical protein